MYCLECGKLVIKRINYKNFHKRNKLKICERCFIKSNYIQELDIVPIENGIIYVNTLFEKLSNPLSVMNFCKPYYKYYLKNKGNNSLTILQFDTLDNELYNLLNKLNFGNIYLIVINNILQKENDYEN